MSPFWILRTARLMLTPVGGADLPHLRAIKADPRVFAIMLGGVRNAAQTAEDLAHDAIASGEHGGAFRFGHDQAGLKRIGAAARATNFASRTVLGSIGMVPCEEFVQRGY